jgi:member of the syntaxin family of t-SNAREs
LFSSYLRIRTLAASSSGGQSTELAQARSELEQNLGDLTTDLQDLVESVKAVEGDPYRYGLDVDEVNRRRRLVEEVGGEVEDMREELAKRVDAATSRQYPNNLPDPSAFDEPDSDSYAQFEQQQQVELMHQQDAQLDSVFQTVGNLRDQADVMGRELEEQGELLDEVDTMADRMEGRLKNGIKRVGWIVKKNEESASSCCIGILILVLIILLILLLVL